MQATLDVLPFDIMHVVASSLDAHDYVHLSRVSRRYRSLLQNETISRRTLQETVFHTREGKITRGKLRGTLSSGQAMEHVHNVRQSVASARPYSASVLAYGESLVYCEGILCYVDGYTVRVLDVHGSSKAEEVIDVLAIEERLAPQPEPLPVLSSSGTRVTKLSYSEGVLVCLCESQTNGESWLLVIDLGVQLPNDGSSTKSKRRPFRHPLSCTTKLFIQLNRSYLYYGTHSGLRPDGHHEWLVNGLDLSTECLIAPKPFRLADFVGSDIGSTACFKIHEGSLFAVSNQTSFEVEEVDWTSYYHCIKIPLGEAKPDLETHPIWQRQHGEGPINDSWTDLSLQVDEQTNELLIVECRKEWLGGGSANIRTYYTQPLRFNKGEEAMQMCNFPTNDPLTRTLDEHSKPHFSEPRKRIRKHYHHEYEQSLLDPRNPNAPRDFILAKTKFRAYNPSAMSFLDLVSDPAPLPNSLRTRDRLRLRIASRKQKSPLISDPDHVGQSLLRRPELDENGDPLQDSEIDFHPTEVHLWPPDDAPPEIYDVLCPGGGRVGDIDAVADERSIIYMTDAPNGSTRGKAIVMISFDPSWGREFKKLIMPKGTGQGGKGPERAMRLELPNSFSSRKSPKRVSPPLPSSEPASTQSSSSSQAKRQKCHSGQSEAVGQTGKQRRIMWQEDAMYLSINRGYRLR